MSPIVDARVISLDEVLARAEADAIRAYQDLDNLRREVRLEDGKWFVEYRLDFPAGMRVAGGGPHYVIDATTGEIISKKYYQ